MTLEKIKLFSSSINKKKVGEVFDRYKVLKQLFEKKILVFDIGANVGQTILEISKNFKSTEIHSFEPQSDCINQIKELITKLGSKHKVIVNNLAVGNKIIKKKRFFQNKSSDLSSFLKINTKSKLKISMKELSKQKSFLKTINKPTFVEQTTLNHYLKIKKISSIDILKIDTQGYEKNVLLGCSEILKNIKVICLEMNFWDYYEKSLSFFEIEKLIKSHFQFWDVSFIYKNPKWHCTDYMDVIYINKNFLKKILK